MGWRLATGEEAVRLLGGWKFEGRCYMCVQEYGAGTRELPDARLRERTVGVIWLPALSTQSTARSGWHMRHWAGHTPRVNGPYDTLEEAQAAWAALDASLRLGGA